MNKETSDNLELKKLNLEILKTDKRIAELKYQDKLIDTKRLLLRIIILGDFLEAIKSKEYISTIEAKRLVEEDEKLINTFSFEGDKAYINWHEFGKLHDEFMSIKAELMKEKVFLGLEDEG